MPSTPSRRRVVSVLGTSLVPLLSGCFTSDEQETPAGEWTNSPSSTDSNSASATSDPDISDSEATERALAAEEGYLERQLSNASCLSNWGTSPTTVYEEATVLGRSEDGVRVEVSHPFSYTETRTKTGSNKTVQLHADGGTTARYLVTVDGEQRLDGDTIAPC